MTRHLALVLCLLSACSCERNGAAVAGAASPQTNNDQSSSPKRHYLALLTIMLVLASNPEEVGRELSVRVRALRLARGWTREELAERAGLSFSTLRLFEQRGQISLERLVMTARALDVLDGFEALFKSPQVGSLSELERPTRRRGRRRAR